MQWNRVWWFFVIVAVGLVLSWGQVGRQASQTLSADRTSLLETERPCAPRRAPCAAFGGDLALVLGPEGEGVLRLQAVGQPRLQLDEAVLVERGGGERERIPLDSEPLGPGQWRIALPRGWAPDAGGEVQLRLDGPPTTAVFPLR